QRKGVPPAFIAGFLHGYLAPAALAAEPAPHAGPEMHMAVHENVGFDFQHIAHDAFRRMAAAGDLWFRAFDNDAPAAEIGRGPGNRMTLRRPVRLKRSLAAPGMKEAKFQWLKDKRPAGFETHGDPPRRLVDKRPKQPACLAQEASGLYRQGSQGI